MNINGIITSEIIFEILQVANANTRLVFLRKKLVRFILFKNG